MNTRLQLAATAEHKVAADLSARGLGVAWPTGHGHPFDLILVRQDSSLERVQVKHTRSNGRILKIRCDSRSEWVQYSYRPGMVEWIAVWDETTDACFYLPIQEANDHEVTLRLAEPLNRQQLGIRWAADYRSI